MAYKDKEIKKLYYSIGEVATMFNVSTSLIRYWESEFTILKPRKNRKGNRMFTEKDISHLRLIYHLVKERGFTLDGAKNQLKDNRKATENQFKAISSLQSIKEKLLAIKEQLNPSIIAQEKADAPLTKESSSKTKLTAEVKEIPKADSKKTSSAEESEDQPPIQPTLF